GKSTIVITEMPYQVNKARLVERIAELVKEKRVEGIAELRDESDKEGIRVVIELRRGESPEVVLNNLYQHTQLQTVFGINMVALVDGQPQTLNLKQILEAFLRHRREVVTRRTMYDLRKARERAHVLEGLAVALSNIDEVIGLIKGSAGPAEAKDALIGRVWPPGIVTRMLERADAEASRPEDLEPEYGLKDDGYHLSPTQAQAILDLRLHRLTGLEREKITNEYREILDNIAEYREILANPDRLMQVIRDEFVALRDQFADKRRTEIQEAHEEFNPEDLISEEDVVVTLSHAGYAKSQPLSAYSAQRRGGRGKAAARVKEEDFIDKLFVANTHDTLLCFSSRGKVYWLKVYDLPQAGRTARGRPVVNLLPLEEDERLNAVLAVREFEADKYILMATARGLVKKTPLTSFFRPRASGIIAIDLRPDDHLVNVELTDGYQELMLLTSSGKAIRFKETDVRPMGRVAAGVRGIRLEAEQRVIALTAVGDDCVLTVTENGYGKRTPMSGYPLHKRGGQGVISIQTTERNGPVVGAARVSDEDEIMLISNAGTLVRTRVSEIPQMGRNAQGVRLIRLGEGERLSGVARIESLNGENGDDDSEA
ncbi:MAG: DNA gyrase subunit A, partial [Gammaproteobacteria bacterium]|nr:DNA gyrase subunit A [Gammaproteobacteria bacterium]